LLKKRIEFGLGYSAEDKGGIADTEETVGSWPEGASDFKVELPPDPFISCFAG